VITIDQARTADDALVAAMGRLVPLLSRSADPPDREQLEEMVSAPGTVLLTARDGAGEIVGTLTLVTFRIPTGIRAWIEDVIVDEAARGQGVGEALTRAALDAAAGRGAKTVDLTSRPSREAANRLYQRMGFEARHTNVYRYTLGG
jgi:ribosomal protein S18 acetylase RimI-like enzyme